MRQLEGNKTVKRLSMVLPATLPLIHEPALSETIDSLTAGTLAWLARIRSSLLLKTASFELRAKKIWPQALHSSIAANSSAMQRSGRTWTGVWQA
jgi:hypothetical protein